MLTLYLADEMAPAERAAFEQRLASDETLSAELQTLRAAQEAAFEAINRADRSSRLPASQGVAVRRVIRAVQQWQTRRLKPTLEPARRGLPLPWWCYPAAAAASIITAFLIWSSRQEVGPTPPALNHQQWVERQEEDLAKWMGSSFAFDDAGDGSVESILATPLTSTQADDLNSIFLIPPSEETIQ